MFVMNVNHYKLTKNIKKGQKIPVFYFIMINGNKIKY